MGEEGNTESDQFERPLKNKNPKCFFVKTVSRKIKMQRRGHHGVMS